AGERAARENNHEVAMDRFQRSIAVDQRSEKPRLALARSLVELRRSEEAMAAAHGALVVAPSSLEAAGLPGDLYTKHNKHAEAAQIYEYSSRAHPSSFDLVFGLGKSLAVLGRAAEAAAALRRAVDLDPKNVVAAKMLARSLDTAGKAEEALPVWK